MGRGGWARPFPAPQGCPLSRDEDAAKALKNRTLTNLYNALDVRGWQQRTDRRQTSPDDDALRELLALNGGRRRDPRMTRLCSADHLGTLFVLAFTAGGGIIYATIYLLALARPSGAVNFVADSRFLVFTLAALWQVGARVRQGAVG